MKPFPAIAIAAILLAGCSNSFDGRYPIDTIKIESRGTARADQAVDTFPLNAWFEIESGKCIRVHAAGVTSTYRHPKIKKTVEGFEAISDNPRGPGKYSWSFEEGKPGGLCCLTFTHDGVHHMMLLSKGKEVH
ncbi:MAG TPA: hypothetical protein VK569_03445 [Bacteroidota bacterium]|nr:hypothetical protein [Bacteroidota bacterium]